MKTNSLSTHDRAVSNVIGTILMLGIIISASMILQLNTMQNHNLAEENSHAKSLQQDFGELSSSVWQTAETKSASQIILDNTITYKNFYNRYQLSAQPLTFSTSDTATIKLNGIKNEGTLSYDTRFVSAYPDYYMYQPEPAFRMEHGVSFRDPSNGDGTAVATTNQNVVNGKTLNLYIIDNSVTVGQQAPAVKMQLKSSNTQTLTNSSGSHVKVKLPTKSPESEWRSLLEPELDENGGHVTGISYTTNSDAPNVVTIQLEQGISYELNAYYIGLGVQ